MVPVNVTESCAKSLLGLRRMICGFILQIEVAEVESALVGVAHADERGFHENSL